jgi:hypothetical protein
MNKDTCLVARGAMPAKASRASGSARAIEAARRRRRRVRPGGRRFPARATPVFHYLAR